MSKGKHEQGVSMMEANGSLERGLDTCTYHWLYGDYMKLMSGESKLVIKLVVL